MFGVSHVTENSTPSRPAVRRARPVHSCLDCRWVFSPPRQPSAPAAIDLLPNRNRKLKCDRGRPCGQCTKAGRPNDCHYDSTAGSMSRVDSQDNEPASKRQRTGESDLANGFAPGNWGLNTPASVQYGAYGNATLTDGTNQSNGSVGPMTGFAATPGVAQQAYMAAQNQQQHRETQDSGAQALSGARAVDKMGVVEDLQARVARLEKLVKVDSAPKDDDNAQTSKTGAAEMLVDLRHSHSSAMNPKRSIVHQVCDCCDPTISCYSVPAGIGKPPTNMTDSCRSLKTCQNSTTVT